MSEFVVALTTCATKDGQKLARILVEERVCACVNIIPKITSIYHWKDDIVVDNEALLIIKTESKLTESLWEIVKKNHPYEVPEYIVLPIEWGSQDYLEWIAQSIKSK